MTITQIKEGNATTAVTIQLAAGETQWDAMNIEGFEDMKVVEESGDEITLRGVPACEIWEGKKLS